MILDKPAIKKILVIKLRAIGDVLLSTVILPDLRKAFPDASIGFLCDLPAAPVVRGNPNIDHVIVFDATTERGLSLIRKVRAGHYDMVIDLFGNPRSALVALTSGARYRVGYKFGWRQYCYSIVVQPRGGTVHNTEFNLDAMRALGIPVTAQRPFFPVTREADDFADEFIRSHNLGNAHCIALNSGGGWYTKRWKPDWFAMLGNRLRNEFGSTIILIWGPGEYDLVQAINKKMDNRGILTPATTLTQLGAIVRRCKVCVTNDSGPMHIAAALGVPIVAIFGPTNPALQGPVTPDSVVVRNEELDCLGCNLTKCPIGNPCMEKLSVEQVFNGVKSFIDTLKN